MRTSWPVCLFAVVVVCLYQTGICRESMVRHHRSKKMVNSMDQKHDMGSASGLPPTDVAQTNPPCTETSLCETPTPESNTADAVVITRVTTGATTTVRQTEAVTTERSTTIGTQTVTTSKDPTQIPRQTDPTTDSASGVAVTSEDQTEAFTAEPSGSHPTDVIETDAVTTSSSVSTEGETVTSEVPTDAFTGESSGVPPTDVIETDAVTTADTTTSPVTTEEATVTSEDPTEDFGGEPSGLPPTDTTTERPATDPTTTIKPESPCASSPCKNGARCQVVGKSFRCRCRPSYAGRKCQIKVGYSKSKFREWLLKVTFTTEDADMQLPDSDKDQWMSMRATMTGEDPEANMDNNTPFFDRILVTNAYARTNETDGNFLYQGDIIMNNNTLWLPSQKGTRNKRAVNAFEFLQWTKDEGIPYQLLSSLNDKARGLILGAISEWERALPCIRWREKTDADINFVQFFQGQGCFSQVGRTGGRQRLSIGRGCEHHGIILHEMGHTLGLFHEQSRPDRSDFVDVIEENILEGFQFQFKKFNEDMINSYGVVYDYGSIMHYPSDAFAKEKGLETIRARGKRNVKFGQRESLSKYDIKQARAMYECPVTDFEATPVVTTTQKTTTVISSTVEQTTTQAKVVTSQATEEPTEAPTTKLTTADVTETRPITTQASTIPVTPEIQTEPITTMELTTQRITTVRETNVVTTKKPTTQLASTEEATDTTTKAAVVTTTEQASGRPPTDVIETDIATTEEITTQAITTVRQTDPVTTERPTERTSERPTTKPATTVKQVYCDILSNCFKRIRKGHCSPFSPNYSYMKYFCRRTCEIWENSALSRGATCVDLLPECKAKAAKGQCSSLNDREYMENMCCVSCRIENCIDRDPSCPRWARVRGACDARGYLKKYCKKSCNLCD